MYLFVCAQSTLLLVPNWMDLTECLFSRLRLFSFQRRRKGEMSEMFLVRFTTIFLHLLSLLLSVWVVFCHPSMWASQVRYLVARPRTLHPKCGHFSLQYKSLAALGAFALAPMSVQQPCSAGERQVFTSVAPRVVPTQPGAVMKVAVETGVYSHCNIGTRKTKGSGSEIVLSVRDPG